MEDRRPRQLLRSGSRSHSGDLPSCQRHAGGQGQGNIEATFLGLVLLRFALILEADSTFIHLVLVNAVLATKTFGVI